MAKSKRQEEPTQEAQTIEVGHLDIRLISEDKNQPRKHFDEDALKELAADIKQHGIIQPITVRENPAAKIQFPKELADKKCFTIVCGERRYRAAIIAGLNEVPCIVRKLNDDEALEFQIAENLQRKNINPMEESDAFQQLFDRGISTPQKIADKLGVSVRYVYDRLVLQQVVLEVQDLIRTGKLTITHGKQFARLPKEDQQKVWDRLKEQEDVDVDDIRDAINSTFNLRLDEAVFDINSKTLVKKAGACVNCQKRTGCRLVLFEDVEQHDLCLDEKCFNSKVNAHIEKLIEEQKKKGKEVKLLSTKWYDGQEGLQTRNEWGSNETEEETGCVGIVVESATWSNYKAGQLVYLKRPEEESDDTNGSSDSGRSSKTRDNNDYDTLFGTRVVEAACSAFEIQEKKFPATDIITFITDEIANRFNRLEEEIQDIVVNRLEIEKLKRDDMTEEGEWSPEMSMRNYCEPLSVNRLYQLHKLVLFLNDAEQCFYGNMDQKEAEELNEHLAAVKVDVFAIEKQLQDEYPKCPALIEKAETE